MLLRLLKVNSLSRRTIFLLSVIIQNAFSKPQDTTSMSENLATQTLMMAGNVAEMVGNAGMISKNFSFELPFAKANSETLVGTGAAIRNNDHNDDSSKEERRKRSVDSKTIENLLADKESFLDLPFYHRILHRSKRSPCHNGGTGTAGGGGGTGTPTNGDLDVVERRRRAYARRRKMAARKQSTTSMKNTVSRKRKLINTDDNVNQALTRRRKRQTELDDLNNSNANSGDKFSQHAQQFAETLRQVWENLMNSMNDVAKKIKQHLSGQNSTTQMEI